LKIESEQQSYNMILNASKKNLGSDFQNRVRINPKGKKENGGSNTNDEGLKISDIQEADSEEEDQDIPEPPITMQTGPVLNLGDKIAKSQ